MDEIFSEMSLKYSRPENIGKKKRSSLLRAQMKMLSILLFSLAVALPAISAELETYCPPLNQVGFSSKVSCLKSALSTKISKCTSLKKVRALNYQNTSCSYLGYAQVPGNSFFLCENTLKRAKDEYRAHYAKSDGEKISEYLFEATTFYTMIHEALHLEGRNHSHSMDSEVEEILSCAGIRPVFSSYGVFAEWTKNISGPMSVAKPEVIPGYIPKYYETSYVIPDFNCEVTDDGFNFCVDPYELQLKSLDSESSEEICMDEAIEVKKTFKRANVKILDEKICGFFQDSKDSGVYYSSFKTDKKILTSKINVLSPEWTEMKCEENIANMTRILKNKGFKILQVAGCYGRSVVFENEETSMEEFLIRYVK